MITQWATLAVLFAVLQYSGAQKGRNQVGEPVGEVVYASGNPIAEHPFVESVIHPSQLVESTYSEHSVLPTAALINGDEDEEVEYIGQTAAFPDAEQQFYQTYQESRKVRKPRKKNWVTNSESVSSFIGPGTVDKSTVMLSNLAYDAARNLDPGHFIIIKMLKKQNGEVEISYRTDGKMPQGKSKQQNNQRKGNRRGNQPQQVKKPNGGKGKQNKTPKKKQNSNQKQGQNGSNQRLIQNQNRNRNSNQNRNGNQGGQQSRRNQNSKGKQNRQPNQIGQQRRGGQQTQRNQNPNGQQNRRNQNQVNRR